MNCNSYILTCCISHLLYREQQPICIASILVRINHHIVHMFWFMKYCIPFQFVWQCESVVHLGCWCTAGTSSEFEVCRSSHGLIVWDNHLE
jgi:hypothetical protein